MYILAQRNSIGQIEIQMSYNSLEEIQNMLPEYFEEYRDDFGAYPIYDQDYFILHHVPFEWAIPSDALPRGMNRAVSATAGGY